MTSRQGLFPVLGMALALLGGCSSMPKAVQKPDVAVKSLDIQGATLTDATVLLGLEVRNPNSFGIRVDSVSYGLSLNGKSFASGTSAEGSKIAANSDSVVTIPLRIKYWDLFSQFSDFMKSKHSTYQLSGTIRAGEHDFPFQHAGDIALPAS